MSSLNPQNLKPQAHSDQNPEPIPDTFAIASAKLKDFALQEFEREITRSQLYYHTREHISGVQMRANAIFQTIRPYWEVSIKDDAAPDYIARMQLLLDICATSHDMVQIFVHETQPHKSRRREAGVSEAATIENLRRARFQVSFAKSRLNRYTHEIKGLPEEVSEFLIYDTFKHLNTTTIQAIELTTPTADDTPLKALVAFFKLEHYISRIMVI